MSKKDAARPALRKIGLVLALTAVLPALAGCVVVPERGWHHGYWYAGHWHYR
ncbi:MAG: hypothetical protein J0I19_15170 [Alphaproteobacteria bacterium]|nr:hypothetical protein [Alphaproteobacteria bacterium]